MQVPTQEIASKLQSSCRGFMRELHAYLQSSCRGFMRELHAYFHRFTFMLVNIESHTGDPAKTTFKHPLIY